MSYEGDRAILCVHGDVDLLTAPTLASVVTALVDQRHPAIVLDLTRLGFLGAAGLRIIAAAGERLSAAGGVLHLRSPSVHVRRVLHLTGTDRLVQIDAPSLAAVRGLGTAPWDLTDEVAGMLASADAIDVRVARRVRAALLAREVIGQAEGLLMERHNTSVQEAVEVLARSAEEAGVPVLLHATELLALTETARLRASSPRPDPAG